MEQEKARELIKKYFKEKYYKKSIIITNKTNKVKYKWKIKKTKKNK